MSEEWTEMGSGVFYRVEGDELIVKMDLRGNYGPSKSGKTICVASTGGNKEIEGTKFKRKLGLNLFRSPKDE